MAEPYGAVQAGKEENGTLAAKGLNDPLAKEHGVVDTMDGAEIPVEADDGVSLVPDRRSFPGQTAAEAPSAAIHCDGGGKE